MEQKESEIRNAWRLFYPIPFKGIWSVSFRADIVIYIVIYNVLRHTDCSGGKMSQKKIDKMKLLKEFLDQVYEIVDEELGETDDEHLQKSSVQLAEEAIAIYKMFLGGKS